MTDTPAWHCPTCETGWHGGPGDCWICRQTGLPGRLPSFNGAMVTQFIHQKEGGSPFYVPSSRAS